MEGADQLLKVVVIGDSGVGKSALLNRYADDVFTDSFISTVGVDCKIRTIEMDGKRIRLQLWDTAGQERFRTITSSYYRGAHGILLAYAINDEGTFKNVATWLDEVDGFVPKNIPKVLVGTKSDLSDQREVTTEQGQSFAREHGLTFVETSAKNATNVEDTFNNLAISIIKTLGNDVGSVQSSHGQTIKVASAEKKEGCNC